MRNFWEESDIKPGRYVTSKAPGSNDSLSYLSTVTYQICWVLEDKDQTWCFVAITDGMIIKAGSKQDMADKFNTSKNGFVPTSQEALIQMIEFLKNQNKG